MVYDAERVGDQVGKLPLTDEAAGDCWDVTYPTPRSQGEIYFQRLVAANELQAEIESLERQKLVNRFLDFISYPLSGWKMSKSERKVVNFRQLVVLFSQSPKLCELLKKGNKQKNPELLSLSRRLSALLVQLYAVIEYGSGRRDKWQVFHTLSELEKDYGWSRSQVKSLFLALGKVSLVDAFAQLEVEASLAVLRVYNNGQEFNDLSVSLTYYFDSDKKALDFLNRLIASMTASGLFEYGRDAERNQIFITFDFIIYQLRRLKVLYKLYKYKAKDDAYYSNLQSSLELIGQTMSKLTPGLSQETIVYLYTMLVESNK